jgi:hypothetical protein
LLNDFSDIDDRVKRCSSVAPLIVQHFVTALLLRGGLNQATEFKVFACGIFTVS